MLQVEHLTKRYGAVTAVDDLSRTAAYELVKSGEFKVVRIGATIRISKPSFDAWLDNQDI